MCRASKFSVADGVVDDKPELQYLPYSKFSGVAIELLKAQHAGFHAGTPVIPGGNHCWFVS